jgi:mRNA-degrading endonuclease RelE of RelBE toxin-antitoxin system|tara:strand:- start:213 stop:530 length:318 start_codon:yes stop_codon:yes gene_type:complete
MFKVIGTNTYLEEIKKWPRDYKEIVEKLPKKLSINPFVGNQLSYPFLREKRIKEKRVYYLIYKNFKLVLLVAVSGKKNQQMTIDHIKQNLHHFEEVAKEIFKQVS